MAKLRNPYQWQVPVADGKRLIAALKLYLKPLENKLQCTLLETKPLTYGVRLDVFLLGHRPGLSGPPTRGLTLDLWKDLTTALSRILEEFLPGAKPYIEEWNEDEKFQARFEAYIAYTELIT